VEFGWFTLQRARQVNRSLPLIDQAYTALWTEKNNLQVAFEQMEHKLKTREFKLKEMIWNNSEKASRSLNIYANLCISAVSVAVTMFALLVVVFLK
jgi:hypothetical protein